MRTYILSSGLAAWIAAAPAAALAQDPSTAPEPGADFIQTLFVFMLATFIGLGVISRVSRLLHTPLMSLTNAISAIAVVGSIVITGLDHPSYITLLGSIALIASITNLVSAFLLTHSMRKMSKLRNG